MIEWLEFFPFWGLSLFIFGAVFNLLVSLMLFYLRSKAGTNKYTKSQIWALSILAWLFLLNFVIAVTDVTMRALYNMDRLPDTWPVEYTWRTMSLFTAFLLLIFGLVYPRILIKWKQLRMIIIGILLLGILVVYMDIQDEYAGLVKYLRITSILSLVYVFAVFIPVFIWLSEYTRQPSKEGRMIYTILIWGFLFAIITRSVLDMGMTAIKGVTYDSNLIIHLVLIFLVLIKLSIHLWKKRTQWMTPEHIHIGMIIFSIIIGLMAALVLPVASGSTWAPPHPGKILGGFFGLTFGWLLVRPALFSYGLLRFRLLGTQIKAENILALIGALLCSTFVCLVAISITEGGDDPAIVGGSIIGSLILMYFFWQVAQRIATKLLPMSAGAKGVSMKERRNTYLMSLQTAVVKGEIANEEDAAALEELRTALEVTPREHDLLLESIALHEARRAPKREIEEAYLIFRDGRLLSHYLHTEKEVEAGKDKDIVAGMFAAITEYVKEAMARGGGARASMDTISYGASTLLIEREENIFLAVVLTGVDDLQLRQAMRDSLAEVHEKFGKLLTGDWDGNRENLEGIDKHLIAFAQRVERWEK